jgi:DedD protein
MNQELKHRLIGAVVITALAAIFIPMLFDDPIDDTGKAVSELTIPPEPNDSADATNSAPTSIDQVASPPNEEAEPTATASGSPNESVSKSDANNTVPAEPGPDVANKSSENYVEEEMVQAPAASENKALGQEQAVDSLDTGVIDEANQPVKSKPIDSESEAYQAPAKQEKEGNSSKNTVYPPVKKIVKEVEVAPIKSPVKKLVPSKASSLAPTAVTKAPLNKPKEPVAKTNPEMVRWYLQAGSFGRKENALSLFETLKKQGLHVVLESVKGDKGDLYRLKVGPELNKKRAVDIKSRLEKQKIKALIIAE